MKPPSADVFAGCDMKSLDRLFVMDEFDDAVTESARQQFSIRRQFQIVDIHGCGQFLQSAILQVPAFQSFKVNGEKRAVIR